jgi:hypothetical protein
MAGSLANGVYIPAWQIIAGTTNITGNLLHHCAYVHYDEMLSGKACTLEIGLENTNHTFQNNPPQVSDRVRRHLMSHYSEEESGLIVGHAKLSSCACSVGEEGSAAGDCDAGQGA